MSSKSLCKTVIFYFLISLLVAGCSKAFPSADHMEKQEGLQNIQVADVTFTLEKKGWQEEVSPPSPSGYYQYYEKKDGYTYFILEGSIHNEGDIIPVSSMEMYFLTENNEKIEAKLLPMSDMKTVFTDDIYIGDIECYVIGLFKSQETPKSLLILYDLDESSGRYAQGIQCSI